MLNMSIMIAHKERVKEKDHFPRNPRDLVIVIVYGTSCGQFSLGTIYI